MKKVYLILSVLIFVLLLAGCYTSNEACNYCLRTPTRKYSTSSEEDFYACESCSTRCFGCSAKVTKSYESAIGWRVFMCDSCYKSMVG